MVERRDLARHNSALVTDKNDFQIEAGQDAVWSELCWINLHNPNTRFPRHVQHVNL